MIRTSKYSIEPFNINKVEEYLIREGGMENFLAKKIAQEVEERLSKTKIEYLTAPLMREYINAILLENGLEEVRHRLTRLGAPPFEALKLFKSNILPDCFIKKLGSNVSEQFLLLTLLPRDLADLYLSGEVALLNLSYWALRPLSFYLNTETILKFILRRYSNIPKKIEKSRELFNLILNFIDILFDFKPYISEDLVLGDFNNRFLSLFASLTKTKISYFFKLLISQFLRYNNNNFQFKRRSLSLDFSYGEKEYLYEKNNNQFQIDKIFLNEFNNEIKSNKSLINPLIMFDYSRLNRIDLDLENNFLDEINSIILKKDIIFYNLTTSNLINSTIVKVKNSKDKMFLDNKMILDKILINLHLISLEAKQNDDNFYDLLQNKLNSVFELFKCKDMFVKKRLNSLCGWNNLTTKIFGREDTDWNKNPVKSISFFGLNEAIKIHCGIELDRIKTSESFALKSLTLLRELIEEKNEKENENYTLSQPPGERYLVDSLNNRITHLIKNGNPYSPRIIRKDSKLSLNKKISIFKKFEKIINGGIIFNSPESFNETTIKEHLKILIGSKLNAISIN